MRLPVIATISLLALSAPISAQEDPSTEDEDGMSLMERGAQMLMEGMMKEMRPALEGLEDLGPMFRSFAQEMGPALADIFEEVKDWSVYHPPEMLPNGDIIIRRKEEPEETPDVQQDNEQIDI